MCFKTLLKVTMEEVSEGCLTKINKDSTKVQKSSDYINSLEAQRKLVRRIAIICMIVSLLGLSAAVYCVVDVALCLHGFHLTNTNLKPMFYNDCHNECISYLPYLITTLCGFGLTVGIPTKLLLDIAVIVTVAVVFCLAPLALFLASSSLLCSTAKNRQPRCCATLSKFFRNFCILVLIPLLGYGLGIFILYFHVWIPIAVLYYFIKEVGKYMKAVESAETKRPTDGVK